MSSPSFPEIIEALEKNNKISAAEAACMRANYDYVEKNSACIDGAFAGWAAGLNEVLFLDTSLIGLERELKKQPNWRCAYIIEVVPSIP